LATLCNTFISKLLHSINYNYNGLPDTTFESLVSVLCVAKVQSSHRSATSPCTRLSQSVTRLHKSTRSLHRTERSDHRNSAVTNLAVHAENCSSSAQTHITHTSGNGQWWQQIQTPTQETPAVSGKKTKSWSIHTVAVSARGTYNTAVSTSNIHAHSKYRRTQVSVGNTFQDLPPLREKQIPNAIHNVI